MESEMKRVSEIVDFPQSRQEGSIIHGTLSHDIVSEHSLVGETLRPMTMT